MSGLRNLNLQRAFSMIVLFAALFSQIQTLYACDSMEGKPKQVCCCGEHDSAICPMADSCKMHEQSVETSCCEVSYDTLTDVAMMSSTSTVDTLTLLLDGPQPPPDIEFLPLPSAPLRRISQLRPAFNEPLLLNRSKLTYLLTRRLRL